MAAIAKTRWKVLSPLLDELLDAEPHGRAARLAQIRTQDHALGEELAALLAQQADVETAHFLEGSALALPDTATLVEQVVGNYTLEKEIGQGGMGSVWLAHRSDGRFEGRAAVKFLNLGSLGRGGLERFKQEGSVLARLAHPHIARLLDAGVHAGQPYLVLEYIDGEPLDRYCDRACLDVDARVRIFLDVLGAVSHAHNNLILHRDLKPSNILVTAHGEAKLLDFGIAKLIDGPPRDGAAAAPTQAFTPEYAAPEQVQAGDATTATDVYALGVLLYVLLTGTHPTARRGAGTADQMRALIEHEPAPASVAARQAPAEAVAARGTTVPQLARVLEGDLDNILAKALKKAPAERYPSAAALGDDLRRYLDDEPVSARPASVGYRTRKFVRRYRFAVGAASGVLLALIAGVAGTGWQAYEARRQRDLALQEIRYSRASHEVLMSLLDEAFRTGAGDQWREMLGRAREQLRTRHEKDPVSRARILLMLAGRYASINDENGESDVTAELFRMGPALPDPAMRAQIACAQADLYLYGRDVARAQPLVQAAFRDLATARDIDLGAMADCYTTDATLAVEQGDFDRAVARGRALVARYEAEGLSGSRQHLYTLSVLQGIFIDTDRDGDVLAMHTRLEDALRAQGALNTTRHIQILDRRGIALVRRGLFTQAQELLHGMLANDTARDRIPAVYRSGIGRKLIVSGAVREGIELTRAQLAELDRVGGNQAYFARFAIAEGYVMLGNVAAAGEQITTLARLMADGKAAAREQASLARLEAMVALAREDVPAARAAAGKMQSLMATLPRQARYEVFRADVVTAKVAMAAGDLADAAAALDHAATTERVALGDERLEGPSAWRGEILLQRARLHRLGGNAAAARESARQALADFDKTIAPDHPWRAEARALAEAVPSS
jgi:eukaryotic-like serine/threonine-protein kinase